jgi:hypothetical protein
MAEPAPVVQEEEPKVTPSPRTSEETGSPRENARRSLQDSKSSSKSMLPAVPRNSMKPTDTSPRNTPKAVRSGRTSSELGGPHSRVLNLEGMDNVNWGSFETRFAEAIQVEPESMHDLFDYYSYDLEVTTRNRTVQNAEFLVGNLFIDCRRKFLNFLY